MGDEGVEWAGEAVPVAAVGAEGEGGVDAGGEAEWNASALPTEAGFPIGTGCDRPLGAE